MSKIEFGKIKLIALFIILSLVITLFFYSEKNKKIKTYLNHQTKDYVSKYNTLYRYHKEIAEITYLLLIKDENVLNLYKDANSKDKELQSEIRNKLYKYINTKYSQMRKYHLKQLHFHLKNNDSFLRMHRPNKFGDNLSSIRQTVAYVNERKKSIDSFEEGRIYNGYRFVYPLSYKDIHLGSVEISFSAKVFTSELMRDENLFSNFLISKSVIDKKVFFSEKSNYIESKYQDFYLDKEILEVLEKFKSSGLELPTPSDEILKIANLKIKEAKPFSVYSPTRKYILTYIPIKNRLSNKVVASLVLFKKDIYIENVLFEAMLVTSASILLLFFMLIFIYKELRQKAKLQKQTQKEQQINQELQQVKHELKELNIILEKRVNEEVEKNQQKDRAMFQQSKLAQMGEMISMIAHQWRQPLSAISATSGSMSLKAQLGTLDKQTTLDLSAKITEYSQHLSTTIDDFRNFFKEDKTKEKVTLAEMLLITLNIVEISLDNVKIHVDLQLESTQEIWTYTNEVKQVILNIIKNAEDVLTEKNIDTPRITAVIEGTTLIISDNAGGIPEDIMEKIFEPYFSTKTQKDGTGLGLYMSKIIIEEHCGGSLTAHNTKEGAVFTIYLPQIPLNKEEV